MDDPKSCVYEAQTSTSHNGDASAAANGLTDIEDGMQCKEPSTSRAQLEDGVNHILQQKDEQIRKLEEDNGKLKSTLSQKSREYDELVQELERHVELVEKLQTQLASHESKRKEQKRQPQVSTATDRTMQSVKTPQRRKTTPSQCNYITNVAQGGPGSSSSLMIPTNPEEICAALTCFVEENKLNFGLDGFGAHHSANGIDLNTQGSAHIESTLEQLRKFVTDGDYSAAEESNSIDVKGHSETIKMMKRPGGTKSEKHDSADLFAFLLENGTNGTSNPPRDDDDYFIDDLDEDYQAAAGSKKSRPKNSGSSNIFQPTILKPLSEEETRTIDQMQARMAHNVAALGSRALNTTEIAKQCKRLMVAYNIGQRLFAKAVMREVVKSQGSLSELLSKPRAWNKLTDKGREAFKRIYGWLSDDAAIELLCSLSPRRISMPCDKIEHPTPESLVESEVGGETTESADQLAPTSCDEHLDSIINSTIDKVRMSSSAPRNDATLGTLGDSTVSVEQPHGKSPTPFSTSGPTKPTHLSSSSSRWRHDDIPKEKIIDIYEAEKAKLESQESEGPQPGQLKALAGGVVKPSSLNKKVVMMIAGSAEGQNVPKQQHHFTRSTTHMLSSPISTSSEDTLGGGRLYSKVKEPTPIVQEQFEKYPQLDTEEVVGQIKEYLSTTSTSQRQFGESVLGLSQGSVSDLLARPKPWSQLTHKGREPFIRMKMFLEENSTTSNESRSMNGVEQQAETGSKCSGDKGSEPVEATDQFIKDILEKMKAEPQSEIGSLIEAETEADAFYDDDFEGAVENGLVDGEDLDTSKLTRKIKDFLTTNGLSQRAFGEHVMRLTSGSISELLCRPKTTWNTIPAKGRAAYFRMRDFLANSEAMEALKSGDVSRLHSMYSPCPSVDEPIAELESSMTVKEMLTSGLFNGKKGQRMPPVVKILPSMEVAPIVMAFKRKTVDPPPTDYELEYGGDVSLSPIKKMPRFQRTIITDKQKEALLFVFLHEQRPTTKTIDQIAVALGLSSRTVTNWFHNFRTRQKAKELKLMSEGLEPPKLPSISGTAESLEGEVWFQDIVDILSRNRRTNGNGAIDDSPPTMTSPVDSGSTGVDLAGSSSGDSLILDEESLRSEARPQKRKVVVTKEAGESGGASQLDKVIARMHNRLPSATT